MTDLSERPSLDGWECRRCGRCCACPSLELGPLRREPDKGARFQTEGAGDHRYLRRRDAPDGSRPCVYLGEDNLCTCYDDRPLMCRDWTCCEADLRWRYQEHEGELTTALALFVERKGAAA